MESGVHAERDSAEGSRPPVPRNVGDTAGTSCLIGDTICDCLGNGLCMGGVGGALCRGNASRNGAVFVVGVPLYDEGDEAWP